VYGLVAGRLCSALLWRGCVEKSEVVNTLLRDADEQLKMQKMATKFAEDIRAHYHISD
jgi:hypothetical protein